MKVKIKDLKSNPYRDLENYPINREKVETLKSSIKQTGFWDNILARKSNDDIQIAYGHHRLIALQELMKPEDIIDIPVKDLPDSVMIQVMANENMDEWKTTASVIDETVRVAKEFLEGHPEEISKMGFRASTEARRVIIARFLGWNETRISYSLQRLQLIDEDVIDKEAIKELPTERSARNFVRAVKKTGLSKEKQKTVARRLTKSGNLGEDSVNAAVISKKWKPEKKDTKEIFAEKERKQKLIKMETLLRSNLYASRDMIDELSDLIRIKEEFGGGIIIEDKVLSIQVTANFQRLYELLSNILKINQNG